MTIPNFLIIGAQKSGTTTLHDILDQHTEANMSKVKEIRFFDQKTRFEKGLEFYASFFEKPSESQKITGEASPGYICNKQVPKLIHDTLGADTKLVLILRDPIKRAFSQYWDNRRHLNESDTVEEIVNKYLETEYNPKSKGYFSRGVYINQIKNYLDYFDRENIHVMILEDLIKNQKTELQSLYRFLQIDPFQGLQKLPKPSNQSMIYKNSVYMLFFKYPKLQSLLPKRGKGLLFFGTKQTYKYQLPQTNVLDKLKNFYSPYNKALEKFIGKPLNYWL